MPEAKANAPVGGHRALADVRGVILDLDGVLYRGDEAMPGAADFVAFLAASKRRVVCLTNNAERRAGDISRRLASMSIFVSADDIITSGWATGAYLRSTGAKPRVYILGSPALREVVLAAGAIEEAEPDYVVVGIHSEIRVADMAIAARRIRAGARFVATNPDPTRPSPDGPEPECGAIVAFLEAASGHQALTIGKPSHAMFEAALDHLGLAREEVVMIGDTLETDIVGAVAAGLRSILLGGASLSTVPSILRPTLAVDNLDDVRRAMGDISVAPSVHAEGPSARHPA